MYIVLMPIVCLLQGITERLHMCLLLLVPCESNNEDRGIILIHDVLLLAPAQLVNKAKLEEYKLLVIRPV